jgi:hypothetical protein
MNVDETRREDGAGNVFSEVKHGCVMRDLLFSTRRHGGDEAVLYKEEWVLDLLLRRKETISTEDDHGRSDHGY